MSYRDEPPTCARCGKVITHEVAVTLPWAPFAVMCGNLGEPPCFANAEAQIKLLYAVPAQVKKYDLRMQDWSWFVLGLFLALLACTGVYAAISAAFTDGRVQGCVTYPASTGGLLLPPQWNLYGRVDWGSDRLLGTFYSFDDAIEAARKMHCPIDTVGTPQ